MIIIQKQEVKRCILHYMDCFVWMLKYPKHMEYLFKKLSTISIVTCATNSCRVPEFTPMQGYQMLKTETLTTAPYTYSVPSTPVYCSHQPSARYSGEQRSNVVHIQSNMPKINSTHYGLAPAGCITYTGLQKNTVNCT